MPGPSDSLAKIRQIAAKIAAVYPESPKKELEDGRDRGQVLPEPPED